MPSDVTRSPIVRLVAAVGAGVLVAALMAASGSFVDTHDALVVMGFDPDRAQFITALLAGAIAAAAGTLLADRRLSSTLTGLAVAIAFFAGTFWDETNAALASSGSQGRFDPTGWTLTLVAAIVAGLAACWAAAVVSGEVRRIVLASAGVLGTGIRGRSLRGLPIHRPAITLLVAVLLIVSMPVVGDMLNFAPDARMRVGGQPDIGLIGGGPSPSADGGAASPGPSTGPATPSPTPDASGLLPPISSGPATSSARPWLAWRPTGSGTLVTSQLKPPPWTGGTDPYATLTVYLPPGYSQSTRRYPVLYEVPWTYDLWAGYVHIAGTLDGLIDGGQMPPVIVAFVAHNGAPMPDSECVDSFDGQQHLETYMSQTVVSFMDQTYRTIASPAARALFGFSQGGFCAPMLLLRHPDVFGSAASFSGYFQAGLRSVATVNAWRPFGNDQALITSHSPTALLPALPATTRQQLFFVVSSDPTELVYGPQFDGFAAGLKQNGYHYLLLPTRLGHGWPGVRAILPSALEAIAGRWVALGVFAGQ